MTGNSSNSINSKLLMAFVVSSQIGLGIWTISADLAKSTGHDGWISMILAGLIMTLCTVVIMLLLKRYRDQTILTINRYLFGAVPGIIINGILLFYLICFAAFEVRAFTEFTAILFMPLTPRLILSCILLLPTVYLAWNGLNAVCKFSQLIFLFLAFIIVITILLHNQLHLSFLLPVGSAGLNKIFKASVITTFIYLGPELIVFIYPNITDKNQALKRAVSANLITLFFYTFVCLISIVFFGETMLTNLKFTLFDITRFHQIGIVERIDYFFLLLWLPFLESALRIFFFTSYYTFNNVFNLPRKSWIYLLFIISIIVLSFIPQNFNQLFDYSKYLSYLGAGIIILLILCYLFSFLNKRGINNRC